MQSVEFMRELRKQLDKHKNFLGVLSELNEKADLVREDLKNKMSELEECQRSVYEEGLRMPDTFDTVFTDCSRYYDMFTLLYDLGKVVKAREKELADIRGQYDKVKLDIGVLQKDIVSLRQQIKSGKNSVSLVQFLDSLKD